jgi:syntaxin 1B/2/3
MAPLAQNGGAFGRQADGNAILNECREIDKGIETIEKYLENLKMLQKRALDDPDASEQSATNRELDAMGSETMALYRSFAGRIKAIKSQPDSGSPKNAPQVGRVDRKLKAAINQYQNVESDFRKKLQAQMARQYRIVRPDATEAEVREAVEDTSNQQVFSQALMQSDRRGQSQKALQEVTSRHAAIQKIESQMIELAELFQDMEALVVQQEAAVTNIEAKGEEVTENVSKANEEISTAIVSARSRNRKKWWCLLVVGMFCLCLMSKTSINRFTVIIIVVIVVIIVITQLINKKSTTTATSTKRDIEPEDKRSVVPGLEWSGSRLIVPGKEWAGESSVKARAVLPGQGWSGEKDVLPSKSFSSGKKALLPAGYTSGKVFVAEK